jgi:hypothetical protein
LTRDARLEFSAGMVPPSKMQSSTTMDAWKSTPGRQNPEEV